MKIEKLQIQKKLFSEREELIKALELELLNVHAEIIELKKEIEDREFKDSFDSTHEKKNPSDIMDTLKNVTLLGVYKEYNNRKSIIGKAPHANIYYIGNKRTSKKKLLEFLEVNCFVEVVA